jgi:hypothetical protein
MRPSTAFFHMTMNRTSVSQGDPMTASRSQMGTSNEPHKIGRLLEFWEAIDDTKSHFIPDLHLHHLGRETGAHTLGIFQFELDLTSAALDQMKQQQRGQPVELLIGGVLTHVEDLRHAVSLSLSRCVSPLIAE